MVTASSVIYREDCLLRHMPCLTWMHQSLISAWLTSVACMSFRIVHCHAGRHHATMAHTLCTAHSGTSIRSSMPVKQSGKGSAHLPLLLCTTLPALQKLQRKCQQEQIGHRLTWQLLSCLPLRMDKKPVRTLMTHPAQGMANLACMLHILLMTTLVTGSAFAQLCPTAAIPSSRLHITQQLTI